MTNPISKAENLENSQHLGVSNRATEPAAEPNLMRQLEREEGVKFVPGDQLAIVDDRSTSSGTTPRSGSFGCAKIFNLPKVSSLKADLKWLVQDLIPEASLVMLSGESGCGKSTFALALADAIAHGKPFLSRSSQTRHVLIVDRENNAAIYNERFKRLGFDENEYMHIWGQWCGEDEPGPERTEIREFAAVERPLIVFDSLVAFHEGSEQDSRDTRVSMNRFRDLTKRGATVIVIHHTGKSERSQEFRGSSDFKASVDVGLKLENDDPFVLRSLKLTPFKFREGICEPLKVEVRENGEFVSEIDEDRTTIEKILRDQPGANTQQIIRASRLAERTVEAILKIGLAKGRWTRTRGVNNSWCYELADHG